MEQQYLAADLGSSGSKLLLAKLTEERKLYMEEVGRFVTPRIFLGGHICINIYTIYEKILELLERLGRKGVELSSFGADSWASDFGIINPQGELLGLPVFYRDRRTKGMPEEVENIISYKELYHLTTQRRIQDATLCQLLAVKKEYPELLENGNRIMHLGDLLMYFFSGKVCSEISVASYSQLFSMKNMDWENKVFDLFRLPESIRPPVVWSGQCLGRISERLAGRLGINQFEVIAPPVHDTSAAGVAVPAKEGERWAFLSTGSWYLVSMELSEPADPLRSYQYNLSNTGLAFGKTLLKRNVCAMWIIQECRRIWERRGIACDYGTIVALAEKAKPFWGMVDTDDGVFYRPEDMTEALVSWLEKTGQRRVEPNDVGQIARIVYESITLKCRYGLEALERTTGKAVEVLYVVGGAADVDFLNEMLAQALNLPVVTGPREAAATGNACMQAVGVGALSGEEEVREVVRRSIKSKRFEPKETGPWEIHYREFLQMCKEGS
ncbi:MAG: hypothetical protein HFI63_10495 [Lachnospiraceae bacterium]|nr:hypothetical protein [Lachnospiraceae bacterium]